MSDPTAPEYTEPEPPAEPEPTAEDDEVLPQVGESWANDNGDPPWQTALAETAYGDQLDDIDNVPDAPEA